MARRRKDKEHRAQWWLLPENDKVHEAVAGHARVLLNANASRIQWLRTCRALYMDEDDAGLAARGIHRTRLARFNIIRNGIDSLHSRATKNRPVPWVLTQGGNYRLQRKAKQFTKYLEGEFARLKAHQVGAATLMDAMIYGTGAIKHFPRHGRPAIERTWAGELLTDPLEEQYDAVRTLYQIKPYDREILMHEYPEHKEKLEKTARAKTSGRIPSMTYYADMVDVIEAWHLPTGKDGDDMVGGRRVICVDNVTLVDEDWESERFPFVFIRATRDPAAFWGVGFAERMAGTQSELNMLTDAISDSFRLTNPFVVVFDQSGVVGESVDNTPMRIVRVTGANPQLVPQVVTPPAVSEQHLMREDTLISRGLHMEGISEMSAQSMKPAGLNSGKALQVHEDIETVRHMTLGRDYEQMYMDCAEAIVDVTDRIVEGDKDAAKELRVAVEEKGKLDILTYKEVALGGNEYRIRIFPVSQLSQSPAGRLQQIQDMMGAGLVDADEGRELLDWPDVEQSNTMRYIGKRVAEKLVEDALDGEEMEMPPPELDLDYAHKWGVLNLLLAKQEGADDEDVQGLRDWLALVDSQIQEREKRAAEAAAAPPMPMPGPGPMPGPMGPQAVPPMPMAGGM